MGNYLAQGSDGIPHTYLSAIVFSAIVYSLGIVNFLFDKSQVPHMRKGELSDLFGVNVDLLVLGSIVLVLMVIGSYLFSRIQI